mmetsp:Transcript_8174/g.11482  ORF Transcript_8174/g.11482 Transcript_8174/m.11482 type:complete len:93 (-) Transcript_8174:1074-1352(-)
MPVMPLTWPYRQQLAAPAAAGDAVGTWWGRRPGGEPAVVAHMRSGVVDSTLAGRVARDSIHPCMHASIDKIDRWAQSIHPITPLYDCRRRGS